MKVSGLFDQFDNLEQILVEDLTKWLKPPHNLITIQNALANRIFYPQVVPVTLEELDFDLGLLREALKSKPQFLDKVSKKILIPEDFIKTFPNLDSLVWAFVDALLFNLPKDTNSCLWTVVEAGNLRILGTVLFPQFEGNGQMQLRLDGKNFMLKRGSLAIFHCQKSHCHLNFRLTSGQILGLKEGVVEIYGGELGLMIDGR